MAVIQTRSDGFYDVKDGDAGTYRQRCRLELRMKDGGGIEVVFVEQPTGPLPLVDWPTVQNWLAPWYEHEDVLEALREAIDCDDIEADSVASELDEAGWRLVRK